LQAGALGGLGGGEGKKGVDGEIVRYSINDKGEFCRPRSRAAAKLAQQSMFRCRVLNRIIRKESRDAALVLLRLPELPAHLASEASDLVWWRQVKRLTSGLPPTAMLAMGDTSAVVSRDI
jgi:hypothetical protein